MNQLASDNFVRANGPLVSPWAAVFNESAVFQVSGNVANVSNLSADSVYRNTAVGSPNDQYAECTLGTPTNSALNHGYGPAVRCDVGVDSFYAIVGSQAGYELKKKLAGAQTVLSSGSGTTFSNGDILRLQVVGTTITAYKNGVLFVTVTDNALASGAFGMAYSGTDAAGGSVTLWAGGSPTSNTTITPNAGSMALSASAPTLFRGILITPQTA